MWYWPAFFVVAITSSFAIALELYLIAKREPSVRPWVTAAAISACALPVVIVVHNVASALIGGEEAVTFIVALLVAPALFVVAVIGAGLTLRGRDSRLAGWVLLAGAGMGLFAGYALFALFVTSIIQGEPSYQSTIEIIVLPTAALAMAAGAIGAAGVLLARRSLPGSSQGRPTPARSG